MRDGKKGNHDLEEIYFNVDVKVFLNMYFKLQGLEEIEEDMKLMM